MSVRPTDRALFHHLERVFYTVLESSYPMTFGEFAMHFDGPSRNTQVLLDTTRPDYVFAHALLEQNHIAPHRWTVSAAVEPEYQTKGYGREVLTNSVEWADGQGIEYIDGWLWADNERALRLDISLGFDVVGRVNDAYRDGERKRDMLLVERKRR